MSAKSAKRRDRDLAGRRGPADKRRKGARGAADDDVLRRAALQPDGVDEDVEADGEREQRGRDTLSASPISSTAPTASTTPKPSASPGAMRPAGKGRLRVRAITASMSRSYHMLMAPDAPAATAMHRTAMTAEHRM